jgi:ankyrin repeat protein
MSMLQQIADGRTDLVFEYLAQGHPASSVDSNGVPLLKWCAYYGDVSAIKFLMANGELLESLGADMGFHAACFHGHWRLCQFLIEQGADVNRASPDTGETPLHLALCKAGQPVYTLVVKLLLAHGANPNCATKPSVKPELSCATSAPEARHRCIGLPPLPTKRPSSFYWTRARLLMPGT